MAIDTGASGKRARIGPTHTNTRAPVTPSASRYQRTVAPSAPARETRRSATTTPSRSYDVRKVLKRLEHGKNPLASYTQDEGDGNKLGPTGANNQLARFLHDYVQGKVDEKSYKSILAKAAPALDAKGKPAPPLRVTDKQPSGDIYAFVSENQQGKPVVHLTPRAGYDLAHGDPYAKVAAIHELRHVEQHRKGVVDTMPVPTREGDAQLFAQHVARRLYGIPNSESRNSYNDRGYTRTAARLKRHSGPLLDQTYTLSPGDYKKLRKQ